MAPNTTAPETRMPRSALRANVTFYTIDFQIIKISAIFLNTNEVVKQGGASDSTFRHSKLSADAAQYRGENSTKG